VSTVRIEERQTAWVGATVATVSIEALVLRDRALMPIPTDRFAFLVLLYGGIFLAAIALPGALRERRAPAGAVLALGLAGIGVAAFAGGAPIPFPHSASTIAVSLAAAIAEEALFRKVVYDELGRAGAAVALLGSALLFAAIHVPEYGISAFPVDLGAGLLLSWQRWASGTWAVPAATHAAANLLAVIR
jgi:membrane protease YdiL (CAAX protease family)